MKALITVRASAAEIELRASVAALRWLADALGSAVPPARIGLCSPYSPAAPYDAILREVRLYDAAGRMRVARCGGALELRGALAARRALAENLRWLADAGQEGGGHLHIEHYPEHSYLAPGSLALVVVLDAGGEA